MSRVCAPHSVLRLFRREERVLDSQGHCERDESCSESTEEHISEGDRGSEGVPPRFVSKGEKKAHRTTVVDEIIKFFTFLFNYR